MPGDFPGVRAELAPQVEDMVARFRDPFTQIDFLRVLVDGRVVGPEVDDVSDVDEATAAKMVHPYAWLLDRVGSEGIKLTSAGYLPPSHVEAIAGELGLSEEWFGSFNRESQTLPVLEFRESAMHVGLLRRYQGRLLLTPRARGLRADPVALWRHLALSVPLAKAVPGVRDAGILLLAAVAGRASGLTGDDPHDYVARMLWVAGWGRPDGTEVRKGKRVSSPVTPTRCWSASVRWCRTGTGWGRTGLPPTARFSPAPRCGPGRPRDGIRDLPGHRLPL
jgi:hypothetical protein